MCSDRRRHGRRVAWLLLAAVVATAAGCGKKGNPSPPLRYVPTAATDLAARQQGPQVLLDLAYPKTTPGGMALDGISGVEVWEVARPAPREGAPPALDPRELKAGATLRFSLAGADVGSAVAGDRLRLALPVPEVAAPEARYYAVKTISTTGERSEFSNPAALVIAPPPPPPDQVTVVARPEGIQVSWAVPALPEGAPALAGFNVYRRDATARSYGPPLAEVDAGVLTWLDETARFGSDYLYAVTSVARRDPVLESAIQLQQEIRYQDRFPPSTPTDLVALAEAGRVRLVWRSSPAPDLAGYLVYRRAEGGRWERLTPEPIDRTELSDERVSSGDTYTYRVTAVDRVGNESEGPEVAATVR